jgi:TonB family protein
MRRTALVLSFTIICAIFAAGQAKPDRLNVSPEIMEKRLVKRVPPKFPLGVRPNGSVRLKVVVDTSGHPASIEQTSGDSVLGAAMVDAVKQYEYQPYLVDGKPVEVETTVNVTFKTTVSSALVDNPPPQGVVGDNPGGIPAGQSGGLATEGTKRGVTVPLRVRISSGVASGLIVKKVAPLYPEEAREEHVEGTVLLHVMIDKEGNVEHVDLISGHPLLAPAAIEAVRQWKYKPFLLNGKPMEVDTQVQVNFTLTR